MKYSILALLLLTSSSSVDAFTASPLFGKTTSSSPFALQANKKIFIDGEAGTTGLQVRQRLELRQDLEIISPPAEKRKDAETRKAYINEADAVILCLPDAASIEAASFVGPDNDRTVLIDASTAFRTDDNWTYGFPGKIGLFVDMLTDHIVLCRIMQASYYFSTITYPSTFFFFSFSVTEMSPEQRKAIANSKRISNPGCYPTGFIGLTRPLVSAGIIPVGTPLTVNAISGYSGGGKGLIEIFESGTSEAWSGYGYTLMHKHVPEMAKHSGIGRNPIFQPQIANFAQGMVVSVPLHYDWLKPGTTGQQVHDALVKHYEGCNFVKVMPRGEAAVKQANLFERGAFLRPDTLANTNKLELFVFDNDDAGMMLLCARLDNLGKGASGAAVQNMNIALGIDETVGLTEAFK